jgi:hypothetical protein
MSGVFTANGTSIKLGLGLYYMYPFRPGIRPGISKNQRIAGKYQDIRTGELS